MRTVCVWDPSDWPKLPPSTDGSVSMQPAVTARCSGSEPMRPCAHDERLLRRSETKDRRRRRRWDVQGPGGPHLPREPLLGQTVRGEGSKGTISGSEEEARICPEAGPEGDEAARRG